MVAEARLDLLGAAIRQLGEAAGDRHPGEGAVIPVGAVIVPAVPQRVGLDGADLGVVRADLVGVRLQACGEHERRAETAGRDRQPLEDPHGSHGATQDGHPGRDAQVVGEHDLGADLVADRDAGEPGTPGLPVRSGAGRAGRPLAAPEHVRADDVPVRGIQGAAGTDDPGPPAGGGMPGARGPRDVRVPGQRMADQDRVDDGARGIALRGAERLVGDPQPRDPLPRLGQQRAEQGEAPVPGGITLPPATRGRPARPEVGRPASAAYAGVMTRRPCDLGRLRLTWLPGSRPRGRRGCR